MTVEVAHVSAVSWVVAFGSDCDISWSCRTCLISPSSLVARLVLYSPAVSFRDCTGIASTLWIGAGLRVCYEPVDWCLWSMKMRLNTILNVIGKGSMRFQD